MQEGDLSMSKPTPIVLILFGIGLGFLGLRLFDSSSFYWVLVLPVCLVLYGTYLYATQKRPNPN